MGARTIGTIPVESQYPRQDVGNVGLRKKKGVEGCSHNPSEWLSNRSLAASSRIRWASRVKRAQFQQETQHQIKM